MKQYIALIEGAGEGCDYTIGCNLNWSMFAATDEEEILKEVKDIYDFYGREERVESIKILEIAEFSKTFSHHDLEDLFLKEKEEEILRQEEEQRKIDEEEFEKLKAKLGK